MFSTFKKHQPKFDPWSVDVLSGHCASGTELHVCFDPTPTKTGAIKAVGPFGGLDQQVELVTEQMKLATVAIERAMGGYVAWGESYDKPEYEELQISILGERYGFYPNIALRSSLFFRQPCDISIHQREWVLSDGIVRHRSNGLSSNDARNAVDLEVLHPTTFDVQLNVLRETASSFFGSKTLKLHQHISGWNLSSQSQTG
jgi:hypothetical protein